MKKSTIFLIILVAIFFTSTLYLLNKESNKSKSISPTKQNEINPVETMPPTIIPTDSINSEKGTVTGNLCYPSEGIPPGTIVAKNISTGETFTQKYDGTAVDPSSKFSFPLSPGIYHFKFEVGSGGSAGYYNKCAKTMTSADCTPDENHQHLDVLVESDQTTSEISLCDFYYTSDQETMMKSTF
ncbi:MAG: hypothetical protein US68_C0008G0010 [Candidatus Shapirobacteria bacterium GW2011_GWE1_38_10]|uniref:Uncharacterized protein n=1 Tax=Candidatus Shapirobacteria bacterium GW2011_GWE1_38_10 TaxID=1618488 RepID=A0A0G0IGL4_9BACT|nr:MAG: hypothetical protein US46_C0006G0135 [Candidatus Shapirobacteria bacterium GW2011_GWF2_37_20]KKQ50125.1 MAG: hypothetical protein US68_C0008G0010 [Candidatus Shapirobacteria bacterium GW2011_GWE1_38_10]KKQ63938.1 MAG: hypothetical protein US85_C0013G0012 [Candidatus Shapirobacteria bacterium GW2011_GWF1_38_23]HBP51475.1 hypothetical protein [Candidatus Shapirobacteria bacterium]